jgi:hypothetical protein
VPSNADRAAILVRVLRAGMVGDSSCVADCFTEDLVGWGPALSVRSAAELAVELEDVDEAFSELELSVTPLEVVGECAVAEWVVTLTHSASLDLDEIVVGPTHVRAHLHGVTVAEFTGDRIRSFRHYWNEVELVEQLGLLDG